MLITGILFNGERLDVYTDLDLKFNIQVNDIAEVKDRQATYTNSYNIPKTANNVRILGGLSVPSDTSPFPYQKPNCSITLDGFPIIVRGWLNIKESTDFEYKIFVYSGIIDFFKSIENKTIGADLDLSDINHIKNLTSVVASFDNPNYRYFIADYNGMTHYASEGQSVINIDYLVPSVNFRYLWQKIHSTYGFTYSGDVFNSSRFNDLWVTFSKPIPLGDTQELKKEAIGNQTVWNVNVNTWDQNSYYRQLNSGDLEAGKTFTIPEDGVYKIVFSANIGFTAQFGNDVTYYASVNQENIPFASRVNPTILGSFPHISQNVETETIISNTLSAGDVLSFYSFQWLSNGAVQWITNFNIKVYRMGGGNASFSDDLKDFKISDFMTESFNLFGLTPFTEEYSKNIDYRLISERLVTAEKEDWSDKFIKRNKETYVYNNYARTNMFMYQYDDKESSYNDGSINIDNVNLSETKTAFKSKIYTPLKEESLFYFGSIGNINLPIFKLYNKEVKENNDSTTINYKALDKRFHYLRSDTKVSSVWIGSKALNQKQLINTEIPIASYYRLKWADIISDFYFEYDRIINSSRLHDIEVYLHPLEIINLDLKKLYYFSQEQQYYIINKISYSGNGTCKGEFIRVRLDIPKGIMPPDPIDPLDYFIQAIWYVDNITTPLAGNSTNIEVALSTHIFPSDDPLVAFEWQADTGSGFNNLVITTNVADMILNVGVNKFRVKASTFKGNTVYSNELTYTRRAYECRNYEYSVSNPEGASTVLNALVVYVDCITGRRYRDNVPVFPGATVIKNYCAKIDSITANYGIISDLGEC